MPTCFLTDANKIFQNSLFHQDAYNQNHHTPNSMSDCCSNVSLTPIYVAILSLCIINILIFFFMIWVIHLCILVYSCLFLVFTPDHWAVFTPVPVCCWLAASHGFYLFSVRWPEWPFSSFLSQFTYIKSPFVWLYLYSFLMYVLWFPLHLRPS